MSIYGLGVIDLGTAASTIVKTALTDPAGAVRIAALDAIGRYEEAHKLAGQPETDGAAAARELLGSNPDPVIRGRAAITLNFFSDGPEGARSASALATAMRDERDPYVRERVMWTIFRRYAARVPRAVLSTALRDPDETVRIEAVRAYGKLKDPAAAADLQPMLNDPSWRVQEQTSESLLALQGKPIHTSWTAIPSFIHVPAPAVDPLASESPVPMTVPSGKATSPDPMTADLGPDLLPKTSAEMTLPARGPHPRVRIVTTKGNIYVALFPEWAPLTVENFLNLSAGGFYNDNRWFRIVPDFVVQTGEKDDKNAPGPGYTIGAEQNPLEQNAYVISMGLNYDEKTNTPLLDSAGSEYYITLSPQYHLDNSFTVFGRVVSGFDVLGRLIESDRVVRVERISDVTL